MIARYRRGASRRGRGVVDDSAARARIVRHVNVGGTSQRTAGGQRSIVG